MVGLNLDIGDLDEAARMVAVAEESMEQTGFWTAKKNILYCRACIAMRRGELDYAGRLLAQIGDVANETTVVHARWLYLFGRADLARLSGQPTEAQHFYVEAAELSERVGRRQHLARALLGRAFALLDQEAFEKARQCFNRALEAALEIGVMPQVVGAVVGLAALRLHNGDYDQALEWLGVAMSHPACLYTTKIEADRILAQLQIDGSLRSGTFPRHPNPEVALKQIVADFGS
jgi:tetratricopeptide (TPR) repeat protein